jgi:putative endonuclease
MEHHLSYYPDIGTQGEEFVAQWLQTQGWQILHRRWHCRWGELDLVALLNPAEHSGDRSCRSEPTLAFVEVKTRSSHNWDAGGMLAINTRKQSKLWKAARLFLAKYPDLSELPCRFDVALVHHKPGPKLPQHAQTGTFSLADYLPAAFDYS